MKKIIFVIFVAFSIKYFAFSYKTENENIITYTINPKKQNLAFFYQDKNGNNYKNFENLKLDLQKNKENLIFATNGGMYKKDGSPQGLYIENGKSIIAIDTAKGNGNFYLKPNGVFYITKAKKASICKTTDFKKTPDINFATQSEPMLLINGEIHLAFQEKSTNLNIRNGVGILPNNEIVFAMSKTEINFYEFAEYFKNLGCKSALYLDGFVSRTYLPAKKWLQTDGNFGVIIGVYE